MESSQSMIRILGLSATLPNYIDVARFLHVNPYVGLYFFDGRFRPVPLGQTFVGKVDKNWLGHMLIGKVDWSWLRQSFIGKVDEISCRLIEINIMQVHD